MSIVHKITRFVMPCLKEHDKARNRLQTAFETIKVVCDDAVCELTSSLLAKAPVFTEQHLITNKRPKR